MNNRTMNSTLIIKQISAKILVGISLKNNRTGELWRQMMLRIKEIKNKSNTLRYSLQVFPKDFFKPYNPEKLFTKFALVEVNSWDKLPNNMIKFELEAGTFAVFHYKGPSNDPTLFKYIFTLWLPFSKYELDDRPHFEVLGANYKT